MAEVLITLGVIGVVAAMTMPAVINNFQKKETETKLLHFSSILQQANRIREKDEVLGVYTPYEPPLAPNNPDEIELLFNNFWRPYMKTSGTEKLQKGLIVKLENGSAFYIRKHSESDDVFTSLYLVFCTNLKYCRNIDEAAEIIHDTDGKHTFTFWETGLPPTRFGCDREVLKERCKERAYECSTLLMYDGWKIKKDYPRW